MKNSLVIITALLSLISSNFARDPVVVVAAKVADKEPTKTAANLTLKIVSIPEDDYQEMSDQVKAELHKKLIKDDKSNGNGMVIESKIYNGHQVEALPNQLSQIRELLEKNRRLLNSAHVVGIDKIGIKCFLEPKIVRGQSKVQFKVTLENHEVFQAGMPVSNVEAEERGEIKGVLNTPHKRITKSTSNLCVDTHRLDLEIEKEMAVVSDSVTIFKRNAHDGQKCVHRVLLIAKVDLIEIPASEEYVASYRKAIKEGKIEEAKQFAKMAIDSNPACFAK
jgi:hypothetical protein